MKRLFLVLLLGLSIRASEPLTVQLQTLVSTNTVHVEFKSSFIAQINDTNRVVEIQYDFVTRNSEGKEIKRDLAIRITKPWADALTNAPSLALVESELFAAMAARFAMTNSP